ncbi:hypothetical protein EDB81DRAFT_22988 [Dactylonectria macrodidyma]|uniref:Uncharacterized protein n=1 Tax=Dactylonectria macrodidyma TaxID=307937 RepID=A0A9P9FT56_9HYPO|nr:hypothetical protein EDB81DRAFT_22988 [Dactylonectria macrodidyma]
MYLTVLHKIHRSLKVRVFSRVALVCTVWVLALGHISTELFACWPTHPPHAPSPVHTPVTECRPPCIGRINYDEYLH